MVRRQFIRRFCFWRSVSEVRYYFT